MCSSGAGWDVLFSTVARCGAEGLRPYISESRCRVPGFVVARADRRDGWGYPALVVGTALMARISVCYCTVSGIGVVVVKEPLVAVTVTE